MRSFVGWGVLPLALACSFNPKGVDTLETGTTVTTGPGDDAGTTDAGMSTTGEPTTTVGITTSTGEPGVTSEPETTQPTTTEPVTTVTTGPEPGSSTTEVSTTEASTTEVSTTEVSTTEPRRCREKFYKQVFLVEDAAVVAPMQKSMSGKGEGVIAFSPTAEEGSATFTVDLPCDDEIFVWVRVQDSKPGTVDDDPDSYYVSTDGAPGTGWYYGCQTEGKPAGYHWLRVTSADTPSCGGPEYVPNLSAGSHTFLLRNGEPKGVDGTVAAVARLLITNDMSYVPVAPE